MDIERILADMVTAASDAAEDEVGEIKDYARRIMENEKDSLEELAKARIEGQIDDEIFDREVERQKTVVETELLAIRIMTQAAAQRAVNSAMNAFRDAVRALI